MTITSRQTIHRLGAAVRSTLSATRERAAPIVDWTFEVLPVFGRRASAQRRQIVLAPYERQHSLKGTILKLLTAPALALICLAYGFFFGLTAPTQIVAFIAPIFVLAALIIWALPHQLRAPTVGIELLYPTFFVALILWPNYLAISLPGLPWITLLRLIGLPMVVLLLVSLSVSPPLQRRMQEGLNSVKMTWIFMRAFILVQIITVVFSKNIGASGQLVFNNQIYLTSIFAIGCIIFRNLQYVERYFGLLCFLSLPIIALLFLESSQQHLPWYNYIPEILRVHDSTVDRILAPSFRAGTNFFRSKGTFSTQLETAEYLALLTPLFLYFIFNSKNLILRIISIVMIPVIFIAIRLTDSRLGIVGMIVSILLYGVLWTVLRWRSRPSDLLAAATVYAYPAVFLGLIGLIFSSHRLHDMALGGSAQASSTEARNNQLAMAMKGFMAAPWGHGAGQASSATSRPPI